MRFETLIRSLLCTFILLFATPLYAADEVFIVQDIKVEATAKSAVVAREIAFNRALSKSFKLLTKRMVDRKELKSIEIPKSDEIADMVLDFEITSEKSSSTSYRATYTIRYNKSDVRSFFSNQQVSYTDISGQRLLVLPFLQVQNQTILWNEQNPFLKGWQQSVNGENTLTKIIVPINDLQDMIDIKDHEALTYKTENMNRLISRYNAREAVILIASPVSGIASLNNEQVNLYIYKTDNGRPEYIDTLIIKPANGKDIVQKSINETKRFLQDEWKRKHSIAPTTQKNMFNVVVRYPSIDQWIRTKTILEQNIGKNSIILKSLRTKEATLQVNYSGSVERLNLSLKRAGFAMRPVGAGYFELYKTR